jgi:hypothetical protein
MANIMLDSARTETSPTTGGAPAAGVSPGAGRGVAVELGALGAALCVTGRTTGTQRSEMNRPETIDETAAPVDEAGDHGIPVRVDPLLPSEDSPTSTAAVPTPGGTFPRSGTRVCRTA